MPHDADLLGPLCYGVLIYAYLIDPYVTRLSGESQPSQGRLKAISDSEVLAVALDGLGSIGRSPHIAESLILGSCIEWICLKSTLQLITPFSSIKCKDSEGVLI